MKKLLSLATIGLMVVVVLVGRMANQQEPGAAATATPTASLEVPSSVPSLTPSPAATVESAPNIVADLPDASGLEDEINAILSDEPESSLDDDRDDPNVTPAPVLIESMATLFCGTQNNNVVLYDGPGKLRAYSTSLTADQVANLHLAIGQVYVYTFDQKGEAIVAVDPYVSDVEPSGTC